VRSSVVCIYWGFRHFKFSYEVSYDVYYKGNSVVEDTVAIPFELSVNLP
jgi:hypothetical protein